MTTEWPSMSSSSSEIRSSSCSSQLVTAGMSLDSSVKSVNDVAPAEDEFLTLITYNQSMNQWIDQSMNQWINGLINQSTNQWMNQSIDQSINQSTLITYNMTHNQSIDRSIDRLTDWLTPAYIDMQYLVHVTMTNCCLTVCLTSQCWNWYVHISI